MLGRNNVGRVSAPTQGMRLIVSQAISSSAIASLTITNAFSAAYNTYRIVLDNPVGSVTYQTRLNFKLGTAGSQHYGGYFLKDYNAATTEVYTNQAGTCALAEIFYAAGSYIEFDVSNPFIAANTTWMGTQTNGGKGGFMFGLQLTATSFTDFTISTQSGTFSGGRIMVYGYEQ